MLRITFETPLLISVDWNLWRTKRIDLNEFTLRIFVVVVVVFFFRLSNGNSYFNLDILTYDQVIPSPLMN